MRLRRDSSDTGTTSDAEKRRDRGLGPFTGGQLTVIIVTFAALLLFPVGAWALSFTNVSIIDPGGVNRAAVSSAGALETAPAAPASLFRSPVYVIQSTCVKIVDSTLAYPQGGGNIKAEIVTEIHVAENGTAGSSWSLFRNATCSGRALSDVYLQNTGTTFNEQNTQLEFPSGLAIPKGGGLYALASGNVTAGVSASGYLVPAASVPTNA
jgi:hypothetical protein